MLKTSKPKIKKQIEQNHSIPLSQISPNWNPIFFWNLCINRSPLHKKNFFQASRLGSPHRSPPQASRLGSPHRSPPQASRLGSPHSPPPSPSPRLVFLARAGGAAADMAIIGEAPYGRRRLLGWAWRSPILWHDLCQFMRWILNDCKCGCDEFMRLTQLNDVIHLDQGSRVAPEEANQLQAWSWQRAFRVQPRGRLRWLRDLS